MTPPPDDQSLFLSIKELATITGLSAKTLHAQAAKGTLPLPANVIARDSANRVAGGSLDELLDRQQAANRAVEAWLAAYQAALTTTHHRSAITPPPLRVKEAAEALKCSESAIRERIRIGDLTKVEGIGGITRIPRAEIERLLNPEPKPKVLP